MAFQLSRPGLLLLAVATSLMVLSAAAQPAGQSIIFSTPATDGTQTLAPSGSPQNSQTRDLPGSLQAPDSIFNYQAPDDVLTPPEAIISPSRRTQKSLDERNDWTLQTPSEILGVAPMEELLHPPERNVLGQDKYPTLLQRYLARESRSQQSPTNGWQTGQNQSPWQFSRDQNNPNPLDPGRDNAADAIQRFNAFIAGQRVGTVSASRSDNRSGWDSLFNSPAPPTAGQPDLEQVAAMNRFQQLLNASPAPTTDASANGRYSPGSQTAPAVDPNLNQPDYVPNPAGASFTPLTSGIRKPNGLTPLPGITTPSLPPATAPAWVPQPAPWLSQQPQPFVMPQRKF